MLGWAALSASLLSPPLQPGTLRKMRGLQVVPCVCVCGGGQTADLAHTVGPACGQLACLTGFSGGSLQGPQVSWCCVVWPGPPGAGLPQGLNACVG